MTPVADWRMGVAHLDADPVGFRCILREHRVAYTRSGRAAIYISLSALGVDGGDVVLLPAYHCPTMVEPVLAKRATPKFYRLNADLTPDFHDLQRLALKGARAIVVTHFFGKPVELTPLAKFCEERQIVIIEDCSHTLFEKERGLKIGRTGNFCVVSPRKFFPSYDGGGLWLKESSRAMDLRSSSILYELKAALDIVVESARYGRAGVFNRPVETMLKLRDTMGLFRRSSSLSRRQRMEGEAQELAYRDERFMFECAEESCSKISEYIFKKANKQRNAGRRIANYSFLQSELSGLEGCRPLFQELDRDAVPYVMPLLVADGEAVYQKLRAAGFPVWRWDQLYASECEVSRAYRTRLLQLPCHQGLDRRDMQEISRVLQREVGAGSRARSVRLSEKKVRKGPDVEMR